MLTRRRLGSLQPETPPAAQRPSRGQRGPSLQPGGEQEAAAAGAGWGLRALVRRTAGSSCRRCQRRIRLRQQEPLLLLCVPRRQSPSRSHMSRPLLLSRCLLLLPQRSSMDTRTGRTATATDVATDVAGPLDWTSKRRYSGRASRSQPPSLPQAQLQVHSPSVLVRQLSPFFGRPQFLQKWTTYLQKRPKRLHAWPASPNGPSSVLPRGNETSRKRRQR